MRKKILTIVFILILAATIGLLVSVRVLITGSTGLDEWVMRQVVGVAQTYLVPTIEFDDFSYTAPRTVTYRGVRLLAPDGTQVIDAGELVVTLGKIPKRGEPIVIEGVTIRNGSLHLIADPNNPQTMFKGLAPFVKKSNIKEQENLPKEVRLSETLELRAVTLDNASIIFDTGDGQPPMRFDALTLTMNIDPSENGGEIWHRLDFNIDRGDLFQLAVDGRINLDKLAVEFNPFLIRLDVGSESVATLPTQLQQILADYDASGMVELHFSGDVDFRQWRESNINGEILVDGFNMAIGKYNLLIDDGDLPVYVGNGEVVLGPGDLVVLSGEFQPTARINLHDDSLPVVAQWRINRLDLKELIRSASPDGVESKYSGLLRSSGTVSLELGRLPDSIEGKGKLHITEGRLGRMPGLARIVELLDMVIPSKKNAEPTDKFDAVFQLNDRAIRIESSVLDIRTIIARGQGEVRYNSTLDMRINAGPLEKAQGLIGGVGKAIGAVTDRIMVYHLHGTIDEPKVTVKPFGL